MCLMKRSQMALPCGAREGVLRISMAPVVATRANQGPNLLSLSHTNEEIRCLPIGSRFFVAISLIKAIVSGDILGCVARAFDWCFQNKRNASRWQRSRVVFLDKQ